MAFASDKGRQGAAGVSTGGYSIDNSLRFNDNDSAYLSRTPSSAGNRKTWTWSGWVKRGNLGTYQSIFAVDNSSTEIAECYWDGSDNSILWHLGGGSNYRFYTNAVYRDSSSWYHIICSLDTTISSPSGNDTRMKLYVNGEQVTSFRSNVTPSLNYEGLVNLDTQHEIGERNGTNNPLDGYLAEVNFVDGQALTPADFGETGDYGEWKAIAYAGTYGTNGFYLDFSNSGALGTDSSGNSNTWTVNNLVATDQMLDSPTNNFATFSPLMLAPNMGTVLSEGNLKNYEGSSYGGYPHSSFSTMSVTSGKWYFETKNTTIYGYVGILNLDGGGAAAVNDVSTPVTNPPSDYGGGYGIDISSGIKENGNTRISYGSGITSGDKVMCAFDVDAGKIWWGKNGTWFASGNPATAANPAYTGQDFGSACPFVTTQDGSTSIINFGQDSSFAGTDTTTAGPYTDGGGIGDFFYEPPTGFLALCTQNLPEPTVVPSEHFNTVTYTGTGSYPRSFNSGFQTDFLWLKSRSYTGNGITLDAVRGSTKALRTSTTGAETTNTFATFDSEGFNITGTFNESNNTSVAWNWKANGAGVSNTNGTITSTVSANADAGFSIVSYTGTGSAATVGHGLSSTPEMIIAKNRQNSTESWAVYHDDSSATPATNFLRLNTAGTPVVTTSAWNDTPPTSSVFSLGYSDLANGNGNNIIAYCFHSVDGYSKVGTYTGNGSSDGTFVYTGFRPAYLMVKVTTTSDSWYIFDTERETYNAVDTPLQADSSVAEATSTARSIDIVSNGFKLIGTDASVNGSGHTYTFLAFAENPFKYTNAR